MNPFLEKYITLKRQYLDQDGNPSSVATLYDLADELAKSDDLEAKRVLVDLYEQLGLYTSAYRLFTEILDKPDRKQLKKLSRLQEMSQSHGDRFALPRPLRKEEKKQRQDIESVTLLPNTARGEYDNGGDMSGHYHIYFTAYVNHNRERTISVELFFPDASIPPFTLFPPNPYKNKGKKMSNWLMGNIEVSEETSK